jgi:hypothetical protein
MHIHHLSDAKTLVRNIAHIHKGTNSICKLVCHGDQRKQKYTKDNL